MAEMNIAIIITKAMPILKTFLWLILGVAICGGLFYWLFVIGRRKKWVVNIWELKADGRHHLIGKDILVEHKFNKGKQVMYLLKKRKVETFPPPAESVYRLFNKEYADYVQIRDDFVPMQRELNIKADMTTTEKKHDFVNRIRAAVRKIKTRTKHDVEGEYVYIPTRSEMTAVFNNTPMDYDVNMLRIQAIDNREKLYTDKQDWLQKYGYLVAIGTIVVLIIVVLYMSYDYSNNVLAMAHSSQAQVLSKIEALTNTIGGSVPAS